MEKFSYTTTSRTVIMIKPSSIESMNHESLQLYLKNIASPTCLIDRNDKLISPFVVFEISSMM